VGEIATWDTGSRETILETIARETSDGADLVEFLVRVFEGVEEGFGPELRLEAAMSLLEIVLGKPTQRIEISDIGANCKRQT